MIRWILGIAFVLSAGAALAQVRVVDGDTLEHDGTAYRLNGIDAPEYGQICRGPSGSWPCGAEALEQLVKLTRNAHVTCQRISEDSYGRTIATCFADGQDLGAAMVASGHAWAFVKFSDIYVEAQDRARSGRLGIWNGDNTPAWEYRETRWADAAQKAPDGCPIKGNISRSGRIYHPPWSPWYSRTRINLAKGERWFCDEADAIRAGWRAPRWP